MWEAMQIACVQDFLPSLSTLQSRFFSISLTVLLGAHWKKDTFQT